MGKRQKRCENCSEPLGDTDCVVITGVKTKRVWYVHRPSDPRRSMCFRFLEVGRGLVTIGAPEGMAFDPERDTEVWNIQLAKDCRLDKVACEALGLDWQKVRPQRRNRPQRRLQGA
jgi:hypothetical protein